MNPNSQLAWLSPINPVVFHDTWYFMHIGPNKLQAEVHISKWSDLHLSWSILSYLKKVLPIKFSTIGMSSTEPMTVIIQYILSEESYTSWKIADFIFVVHEQLWNISSERAIWNVTFCKTVHLRHCNNKPMLQKIPTVRCEHFLKWETALSIVAVVINWRKPK